MKQHHFKGASNLRIKIALSMITLKSIKITEIRHQSLNPGVTDAEVSLLKLVDEISNGTISRVNDTGTIINFKPGVLIGGDFKFECSKERGLGYFIEFLLLVAPFCKDVLNCHLTGVTNSALDPSVDMINKVWFPVYRSLIGASAAADLKLEIINRGVIPNGGGQVALTTKPCIFILPLERLQFGKVFRIRGIAWTCRVSSGYGHKMVVASKSILNRFLSDVYITTDHRKGESSGLSPGFGITLWAETKNDVLYSAECISEAAGSSDMPVDAEAVGRTAATRLITQIGNAGCVDSGAQSLALFFMACEGGRNASRLAIGPLTSYTIETVRLIRSLLGVTFDFSFQSKLSRLSSLADTQEKSVPSESLVPDQPVTTATDDDNHTSPSTNDTDILVATCFGAGVQNIARIVR